jgi:hypothetical protein
MTMTGIAVSSGGNFDLPDPLNSTPAASPTPILGLSEVEETEAIGAEKWQIEEEIQRHPGEIFSPSESIPESKPIRNLTSDQTRGDGDGAGRVNGPNQTSESNPETECREVQARHPERNRTDVREVPEPSGIGGISPFEAGFDVISRHDSNSIPAIPSNMPLGSSASPPVPSDAATFQDASASMNLKNILSWVASTPIENVAVANMQPDNGSSALPEPLLPVADYTSSSPGAKSARYPGNAEIISNTHDIQISIGTICLTIEEPETENRVTRPTRVAPANPPTPRTTGYSRIIRHYLKVR